MTYKLIRSVDTGDIVDYVTRISADAIIPFDPANTDYQAYLAWVEDGNTVEPAD